MAINPKLIKLAKQAAFYNKSHNSLLKFAFQPPGGAPPMDPSMMGGAPPMDPSMMGGAPPPDSSMGGMPPMDPSMMGGAPPDSSMGGAPPMDPSMMGGAPPIDPAMMGAGISLPGGGGLTADSIRQIMQETLGQLGMVPGQPGPGGGAAGGKPGKPDLLAMSMDIFQIKKMLSAIMNTMDIPLPQEILDGPNRDPSTGIPMPPNAPGSTSDPSRITMPQGEQTPDSSIPPISAIKGAIPSDTSGVVSGGGEKTGAYTHRDIIDTASALSAVIRRRLNLVN